MSNLNQARASRDKRTGWVKSRPTNCAFETSLEKRCPNCGQNHLTSGYCQAIDQINTAKYPHMHQTANAGANITPTANSNANAELDPLERRRAYQRDLMRKRRADGRTSA